MMVNTKQKLFLEAYEQCHEPFIKYCSALAYGKMDTEDLVQDVLLSAYHHFDKIENKNQLLHYLIKAARNSNISKWRKKKPIESLTEIHSNRLQSQQVTPETIMDIQLLYRLLDKLPQSQKEALILFEISGFKMKEIAALQESNVSAIKTKISRGRKKLKELLANNAVSISSILKTLNSIAL